MPDNRLVINRDRIDIDPAFVHVFVRGPHGGRMFDSPTGRFEVYGAILDKYLEFGGPASLLGMPLTDETGTPDGVGRYNHFQGGSIYWTPATGAHVVYGAIRARWEFLGWERSFLGYPVSDELKFDEGGRVSVFQGGEVYWWPDTDAIELHHVVVRYAGMHAFGVSSGSSTDNTYGILGVVGADSEFATRTPRRDIRSGGSHADAVELYRGRPTGLTISSTVIEHDYGDPESYLGAAKQAVEAAGTAVAGLVTLIPYVGPFLGAAVIAGVAEAGDDIAAWVAGIVGDDVMGSAQNTLTPKQLAVLAGRTGDSHFAGLTYKFETPLLSDRDASYKFYFTVTAE
jgi:hypothetical protein